MKTKLFLKTILMIIGLAAIMVASGEPDATLSNAGYLGLVTVLFAIAALCFYGHNKLDKQDNPQKQ